MNQVIRVCGPKDKPKSANAFIINVTSSSKTWTREFSPFYLGPVDLYDGYTAKNMENAWQFSKVYPEYTDVNDAPCELYWKWAKAGWSDSYAHRYPQGKGKKPLYAYWNGEKLDYIQSRKKIYIPLYEKAVQDSGYFPALIEFCRDLIQDGQQPYLFDFDGYDNIKNHMSLTDVVYEPKRKMGHGFVLAMMLGKEIDVS